MSAPSTKIEIVDGKTALHIAMHCINSRDYYMTSFINIETEAQGRGLSRFVQLRFLDSSKRYFCHSTVLLEIPPKWDLQSSITVWLGRMYTARRCFW